MKKIFLLILILLFAGCSSYYGVCRHKALYAASVMQENHRTVIVVTENVGGSTHAQAKVCIDGEWKWLRVDGESVYFGKPESNGRFIKAYSFLEFAQYLKRLK